MNRHLLIAAAAAFSLFGTASVFAQEATQEADAAASTLTRQEVKSQLEEARRAGERGYGEASPAPAPSSTLSASEVNAQTEEARRHGALMFNEAGARAWRAV